MSAGPHNGRDNGYTAEFCLWTASGHRVLLASDPDGVAAAVATVLASDLVRVPTALIRERAEREEGVPGHGLKFMADPESETGALAYFGPRGPDYGPGAWVSYSDTELHPEVKLWRDMESASAFPSDSHIALDALARAVEGFRRSGGLRPEAVSWRPSTTW
jgi:hypothetical protein